MNPKGRDTLNHTGSVRNEKLKGRNPATIQLDIVPDHGMNSRAARAAQTRRKTLRRPVNTATNHSPTPRAAPPEPFADDVEAAPGVSPQPVQVLYVADARPLHEHRDPSRRHHDGPDDEQDG